MPEGEDITASATTLEGSTVSQTEGEGSRYPKAPLRSFAIWVSRQSLPRLIGLLVGNTRNLEEAIVKAEAEIVRLRAEAIEKESRLRCEAVEELTRTRLEAKEREEKWSARFDALADSVLMNRGMLPATPETREMVSAPQQPIEPQNSPRQMELEAEADKLLEMLQRGDITGLTERINDLTESGRPVDRRVLQLFAA